MFFLGTQLESQKPYRQRTAVKADNGRWPQEPSSRQRYSMALFQHPNTEILENKTLDSGPKW
jgi:hypothetical protein